jgi:hypothetical protein
MSEAAWVPAVIAAVAAAASTATAGYENAQGVNQQGKENTKAGLQIAAANEDRVRRANAQRLGEQRARGAQSGFDPFDNSFLQLQTQSSQNAELDALTARYQGRLHQFTQQQEAENASAQTRQGYFMAGSRIATQAIGSYGGNVADYGSFLTQGSPYW